MKSIFTRLLFTLYIFALIAVSSMACDSESSVQCISSQKFIKAFENILTDNAQNYDQSVLFKIVLRNRQVLSDLIVNEPKILNILKTSTSLFKLKCTSVILALAEDVAHQPNPTTSDQKSVKILTNILIEALNIITFNDIASIAEVEAICYLKELRESYIWRKVMLAPIESNQCDNKILLYKKNLLILA